MPSIERRKAVILAALVISIFSLILFVAFVVTMRQQRSQSTQQQFKQEAQSTNQVANNTTTRPVPSITFKNYVIRTEEPLIPAIITSYSLKKGATRSDVVNLASRLGINSKQIDETDSTISVFDTKKITNTSDLLYLHKKSGAFSFISNSGHKPTSLGTDTLSTAYNYLTEKRLVDNTVTCAITYKRYKTPDITYVECHRDWQKIGLPLLNPIAALNLDPAHKLSSLKLAEVTAETIPNSDIYATSTNEDGTARPNDFNTMTVAVSDTDSSIVSIASSIPEITTMTELSKTMLKSPQEALADFKKGNGVFSLPIPAGAGHVDIAKFTPTNAIVGETATVTDFILTYITTPSATAQTELAPYYLIRGTTRLSGYDANFIQLVSAVKNNVLGVSTGSTGTIQYSTFPFGSSFNSPSPEVTNIPAIPTEIVTSAPFPTIPDTIPIENPTPIMPSETNQSPTTCPVTFNGCYTFPDSTKVCWSDQLPEGVLKTCENNNGRKRGTGADCRLNLNNWYYIEPDQGVLVNDQKHRDVWNAKLGSAFVSCAANGNVCPQPPQVVSQGERCYQVWSTSPTIYLYNRPKTLSISPISETIYASPHFSGHNKWQIDELNKTDRLYYEYNGFTIIPSFKKGHDSSRAFIVKRTKISEFITDLGEKMQLTPTEIRDLRIEVERDIHSIQSDTLRISFMEKSLLDKFLPIQIEPKPQTIHRVHLFIDKAKDIELSIPPNIQKLSRVGFTVVETGVIIDPQ